MAYIHAYGNEILIKKSVLNESKLDNNVIRKPGVAAHEEYSNGAKFSFYNRWAPEFKGDLVAILKSWGGLEVYPWPTNGPKFKSFSVKLPDGSWTYATSQSGEDADFFKKHYEVPESEIPAAVEDSRLHSHLVMWGKVKSVPEAKNGEDARRKLIIEHMNPGARFDEPVKKEVPADQAIRHDSREPFLDEHHEAKSTETVKTAGSGMDKMHTKEIPITEVKPGDFIETDKGFEKVTEVKILDQSNSVQIKFMGGGMGIQPKNFAVNILTNMPNAPEGIKPTAAQSNQTIKTANMVRTTDLKTGDFIETGDGFKRVKEVKVIYPNTIQIVFEDDVSGDPASDVLVNFQSNANLHNENLNASQGTISTAAIKPDISPENLKDIYRYIANGKAGHGDFVRNFALAVCYADPVNLGLIHNVAVEIVNKYNLDAEWPGEHVPNSQFEV